MFAIITAISPMRNGQLVSQRANDRMDWDMDSAGTTSLKVFGESGVLLLWACDHVEGLVGRYQHRPFNSVMPTGKIQDLLSFEPSPSDLTKWSACS
jgi:hypothetical protein